MALTSPFTRSMAATLVPPKIAPNSIPTSMPSLFPNRTTRMPIKMLNPPSRSSIPASSPKFSPKSIWYENIFGAPTSSIQPARRISAMLTAFTPSCCQSADRLVCPIESSTGVYIRNILIVRIQCTNSAENKKYDGITASIDARAEPFQLIPPNITPSTQ